jgi:uncharacterized protein (TIGR00645 family)
MKLIKEVSKAFEIIIEFCVFASRWTQAPIYLDLIIGSGLYVYKFAGELIDLRINVDRFTEPEVMFGILGLIDISMVMNLLIIVIIGGYSILPAALTLMNKKNGPIGLTRSIECETSNFIGVDFRCPPFEDVHRQSLRS